jgi:uncharacterized small protein (DUF1192 family)
VSKAELEARVESLEKQFERLRAHVASSDEATADSLADVVSSLVVSHG